MANPPDRKLARYVAHEHGLGPAKIKAGLSRLALLAYDNCREIISKRDDGDPRIFAAEMSRVFTQLGCCLTTEKDVKKELVDARFWKRVEGERGVYLDLRYHLSNWTAEEREKQKKGWRDKKALKKLAEDNLVAAGKVRDAVS